jgi:phenylacetate-coenzyme A ligase PaaK-like adenylate-forming protein
MQKWIFPSAYYVHSRQSLETALNTIPFFQAWSKLDPGPNHTIDERFAALPTFSKSDMRRQFPQGLLPVGTDLNRAIESGEISLVQTSGTTDDKVTNIWNQKWWDASEQASWKLNAYLSEIVPGEFKEAILVNPRNVGFLSDEIELAMEKRKLSRYLYLNEKSDTLSWTAEHMDRMLKEINDFQPRILEANPSMLAKLCRHIVSTGQKVYQPGAITLTYEFPGCFHLRQIREVFKTPLISSYGTTETGYVFLECESGLLHQNLEYCRVDFQPFKPEHGGPLQGRILVTPFNNPWSFVLHFDVGDVVTLHEDSRCRCGRKGIILSTIDGRKTNLTLTSQGRLVTLGELDRTLSILDEVDEYQFFQIDKDIYELYLVSTAGKKSLSAMAREILHNLYGKEAAITVRFKNAIGPERSGKYQIARSLFPINIEEYLDPSGLPK